MKIDISKGRYWDRPWSIVESCTRCSPGCQNCWALAMEKRFKKGNEGQVFARDDRLDIPLRARKPTVWAVWNDLFHEMVPDEFIARAYSYMWTTGWEWFTVDDKPQACGPGHTFLILTKRPKRMAELLSSPLFWEKVVAAGGYDCRNVMPVPYIWHGLTICNQQEANEKIPTFLQVPGKKFLSIEPMLGDVNLWAISDGSWWDTEGADRYNALTGVAWWGAREIMVLEVGRRSTPSSSEAKQAQAPAPCIPIGFAASATSVRRRECRSSLRVGDKNFRMKDFSLQGMRI